MSDEPKAIDPAGDKFGPFETHWMCEPPQVGGGFQVIRDEWNEDFTVRTIHEIKLEEIGISTYGIPGTSAKERETPGAEAK